MKNNSMSICDNPMNGNCNYINYFYKCKHFQDFIREFLLLNKCNNGIIEIGNCNKSKKKNITLTRKALPLPTKSKKKNITLTRKALSLPTKSKKKNITLTRKALSLNDINKLKLYRKDGLIKIILSLYELKKNQININSNYIKSIKDEQIDKIIEQVSLTALRKHELYELLDKLVENLVSENEIFAKKEKK